MTKYPRSACLAVIKVIVLELIIKYNTFMSAKKLDIIIPAYHEEDNITKVIRLIQKYVKTPHLITVVIQDRKDPTIKAINKIRKNIKHLRIIYTTDGIGMLNALKKGISASTQEIIVITMADLADDPRDIDKMFTKINSGYDLICGSRYMQGGSHSGGPLLKGMISKYGCLSLRLLSGIPTHDATNAFKCFRRSILKNIKLESKEGFELPLELCVKAYKKGYKISEVPTNWKDRVRGDSKFKLWNNLKYYLRWYFFCILPTFDRVR